ncbi:MAG: hypothetical protein ABJZ55_07695 [Fuerstiella sp.]
MLWLAPFLFASSLVASARHSHDWETTPIQWALAFTLLAIGYSTASFHRSSASNRRERLGKTAFIVFSSLSACVVITRLLFPSPSIPFHDHTRINRVLDGLLLWPFVTFSLVAIVFAAASQNWRHSLYISFSAIFMLVLALSMHGTAEHWLRSFNSLIT